MDSTKTEKVIVLTGIYTGSIATVISITPSLSDQAWYLVRVGKEKLVYRSDEVKDFEE